MIIIKLEIIGLKIEIFNLIKVRNEKRARYNSDKMTKGIEGDR